MNILPKYKIGQALHVTRDGACCEIMKKDLVVYVSSIQKDNDEVITYNVQSRYGTHNIEEEYLEPAHDEIAMEELRITRNIEQTRSVLSQIGDTLHDCMNKGASKQITMAAIMCIAQTLENNFLPRDGDTSIIAEFERRVFAGAKSLAREISIIENLEYEKKQQQQVEVETFLHKINKSKL